MIQGLHFYNTFENFQHANIFANSIFEMPLGEHIYF